MLAALQQAGLVRRDAVTSLFSLGPRVLRLSEVFQRQLHDLRTVALGKLTALRDETGETAALHVRDDFARVVVEQVESRQEVRRTYPDIGERLSLHKGAPSMVILAFLEPEEQERYFTEAPSRWLDFGSVDIERLRVRLGDVRKTGYALSVEERTPGVISVAAPIFDWTGRVIGAINISGPVQRIATQVASEIALVVKAAADVISGEVGHDAKSVRKDDQPQHTSASIEH
jgi:DNA-binding IclR family transcriptional regulator